MTELASIPTDDEIAREPDHVRRSILAAMQRILNGNPQTVRPGSDSVLQLAVEAGVGRHHLYRRDPDLRLRFERVRESSDRKTDEEVRLRTRLDDANAEVKRLTKLQAETRAEAEQWKGLVELLQRAINVLQEELRSEQTRSARLEKKLVHLSPEDGGLPIVPIRPRPRI